MIRRPPRLDQRELLDSPGISQQELNQNLADIARLNRFTGTTGSLLRAVALLIDVEKAYHWKILDLGTGAGDFSVALARKAQHQSFTLSLISADLRADVLRYAKQRILRQVSEGDFNFCQLDGARLPFADQSVDITICSQTAHHLEPKALQAMLGEMRRVSRIGFILLDLERSHLAHVAIWLLTHITSQNRLTRYDGPLSAARAYTRAEVSAIAQPIGLEFSIYTVFPFRWLAVWKR